MIRAIQIALLLLLLTATGAVALLGWEGRRLLRDVDGLTPQAALLAQRWTPSAGKPNALIDAAYNLLHATNENVNRGCGGGKPCGTLATLNKAVTKIGDSVVTTQLAERTTVPHVLTAMDTLNAAAGKLGATADAATATLETAQVSIAATQPLLNASTDSVRLLNMRLADPRIAEILQSFKAMSGDGAGILADGRKVADKATADYLKPVRWYMQPVKKGGELIDITAAIARHTP
jgi:hypothetical protein